MTGGNVDDNQDRSWLHDSPSWLQIIGALFVAAVGLTATFYTMFYGLKEELARVDERQKFVISGNKAQDDFIAAVKRDRDEQFREITRQLAVITADLNSLKVAFAAHGNSK